MSETKDDIAAERDQLRAQLEAAQAENEGLRGQLATAGANTSPARVTFVDRPPYPLSEGERQALITEGVISSPFNGRQMLASDYDLEVTTDAGRERLAAVQAKSEGDRQGIRGVDYVYPSVAPGVLADDAPVRGGIAVTPQGA